MEPKRYQIQCYVPPWLGHAIPMAKVATIIQTHMPNIKIKVFIFQFLKEKLQKAFSCLQFIGLYPQFHQQDILVLALLPIEQMFQRVFLFFEEHLEMMEQRPNLLIADYCVTAAMKYAKKHEIPFIVNFPNSMSTLQGLYNFVSLNRSYNIEGFLIHYPLPKVFYLQINDKIVRSFRGGRVIFHSFIGLDEPNILPPNYSLIGLMPKMNQSEITHELALWIDSWKNRGKNTFIYVSFGSLLKFSQKDARQLAKTLVKLDHPVIWSLSIKQSVDFGQQLIFHRSWLPQEAILNLEQVKAYVTHCGWGSITEAILAKKPLICIPVFFDQADNARLLAKRHIGISIQNTVSFQHAQQFALRIAQESISKGVASILEDKSYTQSIEKLYRMSLLHNATSNVCSIVQQALEFGNQHLICPIYEEVTGKTGVPISNILRKEFLPAKEG